MSARQASCRLLLCNRRPQAINLMSSTVRRMKQLNAHISSTANSASTLSTATPPADAEPLVLFREQYAARIYTLNRPKAFNALNHEMVQMLQKQIKVCAQLRINLFVLLCALYCRLCSFTRVERTFEMLTNRYGRHGTSRSCVARSLEQEKVIFVLEEMSRVRPCPTIASLP